MKIIAILQARLGSTRLPNKVLLPLLDKPMVQHIIERVQRATLLDDVVLAVPKEAESLKLEAIANVTKCIYARFDHIPAEDVIGRYCGAARAYAAEIIVRIPCDNPCIDPAYIDQAIQDYLKDTYTYYSNTTAACGMTVVDGIGVEVCSASRLRWLDQRSQGHALWREHPHRFFEERGLIRFPPADLRLDVNTQADYEYIRALYDHFGHNRFTTAEVVAYLDTKKVPA